MNIKRKVCQVVRSMYVSSFMEKKIQHACHKQVIFIGDDFRGLITLRGVLFISSCFYLTLRTIFNSSLGGEFKFFQKKKKTNFCISLHVLVNYFQLFGCYLHVLFFLYFVCFVSHMSKVGA